LLDFLPYLYVLFLPKLLFLSVAAAIVLLLIEIFISSGKKAWERKFNIFEKKDE